jgi:hypothetical protein
MPSSQKIFIGSISHRLHVSVIRPSSSENTQHGKKSLTTDPLLLDNLNYFLIYLCIGWILTTEELLGRHSRGSGPLTRSRRSTGSGGESSSMLTSVEGNAVQGRMLL